MASDGRPRKSKKGGRKKNRQQKKQQETPKNSFLSNTIFDSVINNVSPTTAAGIGVTVAALAASVVLLRAPKKNSKSKKKQLMAGKPGSLRHAKSTPLLYGNTPGGPTDRGDGRKQRVSIEQVSKMFQACLQSRQKEQRMLMDEFYRRVRSWTHDMLDTPAQTIVVNFLFWYYRMANAPRMVFDSDQADYLRYWADYDLTKNLDFSIYNLKFDFMYSIALLQRSIPYMKQFWNFIVSTVPRQQPVSTPLDAGALTAGGAAQAGGGGPGALAQAPPIRKKDNYTLTRYQAACILGKWEEVEKMGNKIKKQARDSAYISQKDNYMLNYALRAMEMPQSNPNFGQMHKIVNKLREEYPTDLMPPPRFGVWQVHAFKYKNRDMYATPTDDSKFVVASLNMKDTDNWYHFYPPVSRMVSMARIPREVKLWGRIAQMMSPMNGLSGCLPMTGTWSDLNLYMEMEWTYRVDRNHNRCKHGILELEREPFEEQVKSKDIIGRETVHIGYKWKGTLKITVKDEEDKLASRLNGIDTRGGNLAELLGISQAKLNADPKLREQRIREIFLKEETKDKKDTTTPTTDKTDKTDKADSTKDGAKDENNKLPPTSTTVTVVKSDEKTEETTETSNNNDTTTAAAAATEKGKEEEEDDTEIAIYDIELVIETDIEEKSNKTNAAAASSTPTGPAGPAGPEGTQGNGVAALLRGRGGVGVGAGVRGGDDSKDPSEGPVGGAAGGGGDTEALRKILEMMKKETGGQKPRIHTP